MEFSYLKRNIIRHIQSSKSHLQAVTDIKAQEAAKSELLSKNRKAGLNLGRLCMEKYIKGRPYTDYEDDVMLLAQSGAIVGELNHSRKFPASFRPSVTKVIHKKVESFLKTPLVQTGHLPPCGISADKGTYKHRSRQFLSCVVVMPGGKKSGYDYVGLSPTQIESAVFERGLLSLLN